MILTINSNKYHLRRATYVINCRMTRHSTTYAREAEAERTLKSRGVMYNNKNTHLEFTAFSQKALPLTFSGIDSTN